MDDFPMPGGWARDMDLEHGPESLLSHLMCKVPNLKYRLKCVQGSNATPALEEEIMEIIAEAEEVDEKIAGLLHHMLATCGARTVGIYNVVTEDLRKSAFWPGPIEIFDDLFAATFINFCRIAKMSCQRIITTSYTWLQEKLDRRVAAEQGWRARATIGRHTDEICATVPFFFCPNFFMNGGMPIDFPTSQCELFFVFQHTKRKPMNDLCSIHQEERLN